MLSLITAELDKRFGYLAYGLEVVLSLITAERIERN